MKSSIFYFYTDKNSNSESLSPLSPLQSLILLLLAIHFDYLILLRNLRLRLSKQNSMTGGEKEASRTTTTTTIGSSLIPIINRLQDILTPFGGELEKISLPLVAVVGSQSSGKSSVLEALVGRDFLPRGCDICTRSPLALMLENRKVSGVDDDGREWAEFLHLPGKRFYDFVKVREEIMAETNRKAGLKKGISDKQIRLKISSPNVLNMSLVDLPGVTKVPVGDQPTDIEDRIRKMIMAYIKQENCIILAVSPANSDLATSDALQMAKEADPSGSRTIGVITKLDIMDRGTNACNFLLGEVVPLRLGYVGVVNRCQQDINQNRSIQDALAYEAQFFRDHPVYNALTDRCGIPQLAKKLNQILEQHIRIVLPDLKSELNSRMIAVAKELKKYGEMVPKAEQEVTLLNILTRYCEAFSAMLDGKSLEMLTEELSAGARIHFIFQSIFVKTLEEVDPCQDLTDEDILTAIKNSNGTRDALFVPEIPFELLVKRQIARFLDPCLQCLRFVYDELIRISRACEVTALQRFPVLKRRLDVIIEQFLREGEKPAKTMIENIIALELEFINFSHPDFIGGKKAVELAMQEVKTLQDGADTEKVAAATESGQKSRSVLMGILSQSSNQKAASNGGSTSFRSWGISSIFGSRTQSGEISANRNLYESHSTERLSSAPVIQLQEPPLKLKPHELTENDVVEVVVIKLMLRSYHYIVRKSVQEYVQKIIMLFLVNYTKRELHKTFIQKLYRENDVEELLEEQEEILTYRKDTLEVYRVLEKAVQTLDQVVSDVSSRNSNPNFHLDTSGSTRTSKLLPFHQSRTNGESRLTFGSLSNNSKDLRLFHSEEQSFSRKSNG